MSLKAQKLIKVIALTFYIINCLIFLIIYPVGARLNGLQAFAKEIKQKVTQISPWRNWQIVIYNVRPKIFFYFDSPNLVNYQKPLRGRAFRLVLTAPRKYVLSVSSDRFAEVRLGTVCKQ